MIHSFKTLRPAPTILCLQLNYKQKHTKRGKKKKPCGVIWHLDVKVTDWQGKNQQWKACSCQSQRGGCQRHWEEQDRGPYGPTGWDNVVGERTCKPRARLSWLWEMRGEAISHLWEHLAASHILQHGGLGPMEGGKEETQTPLWEGCSVQCLGRWGFPTLSEVLIFWWFFPAPF